MKDKEMRKAINQASKTNESWLQTYLQSMAQENTLAPVKLVQDLKDVSKHLDENIQFVTFEDKVVVVTSPDFLKEHVMPSAMMRKCAKDLIEARSLLDYNTEESEIYLQDEDQYNILVNYFTMASTIEEGNHLNGSRFDRRLRTEDNDEDTDTNVAEEPTSPPIMISPFTLAEKLVALDDT